MTTYTKLGADGSPTESEHLAVRIEHPLLVLPIIVTAHHAPKEMTWKQAKSWAEKLDINGWAWRLPTVEEAMFIPDRSKFPAIDKSFFPDFEDWEWIWTGTPDAESPSGVAWGVDLLTGGVGRGGQALHSRVRAVRASQ
jgi:Protein of unknown function (DUF1566)